MSKRSRWQLQGSHKKEKESGWGDKSRQRQWGTVVNMDTCGQTEFPAASFLIDFEVWNRGCKEKVAAPFTRWGRERECLNRSSLCLSLPHPSPHPSAEVWVHMLPRILCERPVGLEEVSETRALPLFHGRGNWGQGRLSGLPEATLSCLLELAWFSRLPGQSPVGLLHPQITNPVY